MDIGQYKNTELPATAVWHVMAAGTLSYIMPCASQAGCREVRRWEKLETRQLAAAAKIVFSVTGTICKLCGDLVHWNTPEIEEHIYLILHMYYLFTADYNPCVTCDCADAYVDIRE